MITVQLGKARRDIGVKERAINTMTARKTVSVKTVAD